MAITQSAKKAHRVSQRKRIFNMRRKDALAGAIKDFKKEASPKLLAAAYQAIDKAAKRGVISKNTASRKKAALARVLKSK